MITLKATAGTLLASGTQPVEVAGQRDALADATTAKNLITDQYFGFTTAQYTGLTTAQLAGFTALQTATAQVVTSLNGDAVLMYNPSNIPTVSRLRKILHGLLLRVTGASDLTP